jgi:hypothetical protein
MSTLYIFDIIINLTRLLCFQVHDYQPYLVSHSLEIGLNRVYSIWAIFIFQASYVKMNYAQTLKEHIPGPFWAPCIIHAQGQIALGVRGYIYWSKT